MSVNIPSYQMMRRNYIANPRPKIPTPVLSPMLKHNDRALEVADAMATDAEGIQRDRNLSDAGKQIALAELAKEFIPRVAYIGGELKKAAEAEARLSTINYGFLERPKQSEIKDLNDEMRQGELRAAYAGASENRDAIFMKALESDNLELAHAFLNAPGGSWVSEEAKQRGADEYAKHHTPQAFRNLQTVRILREELEALADQTRQLLVGLGADPAAVAIALAIEAEVEHAAV